MHEDVETIANSLESLAITVKGLSTENRSLTEIYGWSCPAISRNDLAFLPQTLANKLREIKDDDLDDSLIVLFKIIPHRIDLLKIQTVPQLLTGNCNHASAAYMTTMQWVAFCLEPILGWQNIKDSKSMPASLARRVRGIKAELDQIVPEKSEIEGKIKLIEEATEAAESLPTNLQNLREAQKKVEIIKEESDQFFRKIEENNKRAELLTKEITEKEKETKQLVVQCEEAYRITTTKGLAAAFDHRSKKLNTSIVLWVVGLLVALIVGGILGSLRIESLNAVLSQGDPKWGIIALNIILSILSIGGPLWFAWLATKQINLCFRLAEDYSFKASVAKAYEGYKREASRIDPLFEARLFSSALERLEEAPLRFVETEVHGSPWHEFLKSPAFQDALQKVPGFKEDFLSLFKKRGKEFNSGSPNVEESDV